MIPTNIPTYCSPSIHDMITINPIEFESIPWISMVKYNARIPRIKHEKHPEYGFHRLIAFNN